MYKQKKPQTKTEGMPKLRTIHHKLKGTFTKFRRRNSERMANPCDKPSVSAGENLRLQVRVDESVSKVKKAIKFVEDIITKVERNTNIFSMLSGAVTILMDTFQDLESVLGVCKTTADSQLLSVHKEANQALADVVKWADLVQLNGRTSLNKTEGLARTSKLEQTLQQLHELYNAELAQGVQANSGIQKNKGKGARKDKPARGHSGSLPEISLNQIKALAEEETAATFSQLATSTPHLENDQSEDDYLVTAADGEAQGDEGGAATGSEKKRSSHVSARTSSLTTPLQLDTCEPGDAASASRNHYVSSPSMSSSSAPGVLPKLESPIYERMNGGASLSPLLRAKEGKEERPLSSHQTEVNDYTVMEETAGAQPRYENVDLTAQGASVGTKAPIVSADATSPSTEDDDGYLSPSCAPSESKIEPRALATKIKEVTSGLETLATISRSPGGEASRTTGKDDIKRLVSRISDLAATNTQPLAEGTAVIEHTQSRPVKRFTTGDGKTFDYIEGLTTQVKITVTKIGPDGREQQVSLSPEELQALMEKQMGMSPPPVPQLTPSFPTASFADERHDSNSNTSSGEQGQRLSTDSAGRISVLDAEEERRRKSSSGTSQGGLSAVSATDSCTSSSGGRKGRKASSEGTPQDSGASLYGNVACERSRADSEQRSSASGGLTSIVEQQNEEPIAGLDQRPRAVSDPFYDDVAFADDSDNGEEATGEEEDDIYANVDGPVRDGAKNKNIAEYMEVFGRCTAPITPALNRQSVLFYESQWKQYQLELYRSISQDKHQITISAKHYSAAPELGDDWLSEWSASTNPEDFISAFIDDDDVDDDEGDEQEEYANQAPLYENRYFNIEGGAHKTQRQESEDYYEEVNIQRGFGKTGVSYLGKPGEVLDQMAKSIDELPPAPSAPPLSDIMGVASEGAEPHRNIYTPAPKAAMPASPPDRTTPRQRREFSPSRFSFPSKYGSSPTKDISPTQSHSQPVSVVIDETPVQPSAPPPPPPDAPPDDAAALPQPLGRLAGEVEQVLPPSAAQQLGTALGPPVKKKKKSLKPEPVVTDEIFTPYSLDTREINGPLDLDDVQPLLTRDEETNLVKKASVDILIAHATAVGKQEYIYQEAFLATYRTFLKAKSLVHKLVYRYKRFRAMAAANNKSNKIARMTFSLLIRVVNDLCVGEVDETDFNELLEQTHEMLSTGEYALARLLRTKVLEKRRAFSSAQLLENDLSLSSSQADSSFSSDRLPTLLSFKSHDLANTMTLLDSELFQKIEIPEILHYAKLLNDRHSPHLAYFTGHFNNMSHWCKTKILEPSDASVREKHLGKLLKVMKHLRKLNNFNSYLALLSAVNSTPISRLQEWPRKFAETIEEMSDIMDMKANFNNYRQALSNAVSPSIPYLGIIMQDMTHIIGASIHKFDDGTVNFEMRWNLFHALDSVRRFKQYEYDFERNQRIVDFFGNFAIFLNEDEQYQRSDAIRDIQRNTSRPQSGW